MGSSPRRQKTVGNNECLLRSSLICEQRAENSVCLLCSLLPYSCSSFVHKPVFPLLVVGKLLLCTTSLGLRRNMSLFMLVRITTITIFMSAGKARLQEKLKSNSVKNGSL
ncbi:uncharacterized protein [Primulina eburnea]|uniref:uncharacterized protein isoform X2 n=1 Tax=Primulina eburnea TaxID=1245227 RepID=UPI003C6BFFCF